MAENLVDYETIGAKYQELTGTVDTVRTNLNSINELINSSVNSGEGIWDGASASSFLNQWNNQASKINTYIEYVNNQAANVSELLNKMSSVDTTVNIESV